MKNTNKQMIVKYTYLSSDFLLLFPKRLPSSQPVKAELFDGPKRHSSSSMKDDFFKGQPGQGTRK